jgi:hypothetical protein
MKRIITFALSVCLFALLIGSTVAGDRPDSKSNIQRIPVTISTPYTIHGAPQIDFLAPIAESFEGTTFPPTGWIKIQVASGATGFERHLAGETPVPGFNGGYITCPVGGGTAVAFCNYITGGTSSNDEWLITPQLTNTATSDSLTFWMRKFGTYLDHVDVRISTTTPTVAAMTTVVQNMTFQVADSGWVQYRYNIGSLVPAGSNIYIGFRQWVADALNDGASFSFDLVNITSNGVQAITPVGTEIPKSYTISQNYPNPFNPTTNFNFGLPKSGNMKLAVYDMLGSEVGVIFDGYKEAGNYTVSYDASKLASGVYFYRLIADGPGQKFTKTQKMILVK